MPEALNPQVADLLEETWTSMAGVGAHLDGAAWDLPTDCPGWSAKDHYSHLIGIERSLLGEPAPPWEGPVPDHVRNEVGQMNEAWIESLRGVPGPEVLAQFRDVTARRLAALRALTDEQYAEIGWSPLGQVPYRDFMVLRVFDSWVHEQDVRRSVGIEGGRGGAGEAVTLDRVAGAMPYVVGKVVAPPEGTSLVWRLRGPLPRTVAVAVTDGRAKALDVAPKDASATLTLDAPTFWRLGCGRVDPEAAMSAGAVEIEGDEALARQVVAAMNFMI